MEVEHPQGPRSFAEKLNWLFENVVPPDGQGRARDGSGRWSERQIAEKMTRLGWEVRHVTINNWRAGKFKGPPPAARRLVEQIFGADEGYLDDDTDADRLAEIEERLPGDALVAAAMADPEVREIALRALSSGPEGRAWMRAVLATMDNERGPDPPAES